jgi:hypothetical protein
VKRFTATRALLLLVLSTLALDAKVLPYNFPPEFPTSEAYKVTINNTPVPALQTGRGAFLSFGMTAPVTVRVQLPKAPEEVVVRPLSAGIVARVDGSTLAFRLPRPMNLSVELDGDLRDPLFVFANPELPVPDPTDPTVKIYQAGKVHEAGEINLKDGETLYLEGGAVVRGVVRVRGTNVAVRGAGILDAGTRNHKINMLVLRECRNAVLENFIILDPLGWTIHLSGSEDVRVSNTRVIGWRANSDGLDIEYTKRVRVDGCFWRTNDDCIAVKALYPPGVEGVPFEEMINPETLGKHQVPRIEGDVVGDILITNCVLWNDSGGQGFEIGFELRVDTIRGITFRDCDIIHVRGGGAFTIHNGDRARIEDLVLEDIRIENTDRLIDFHVGLSIYSDDCPEPYRRSNPKRQAPPNRPVRANNPWQWFVPAKEDLPRFEANRGWVRNVTIRNVKVLTPPRRGSILNGYNDKHGISNLTIEGLEIAGKMITSAEEADIYLNHVSDLRFVPPANPAGRD